MTTFTLYMRPECHLCDEAEQRLADLIDGSGATIEAINIEHDDALHRRYLELIPVIECDGEELSRLIQFRGEAFAGRVGKSLIR